MAPVESRDVVRLLKNALGDISAPHLTSTRWGLVEMLADAPLITYLASDEQPQFLFVNPTDGIHVTAPDGSVSRPDSSRTGALTGIPRWTRFFLVTDRRVVYAVGNPSGDLVVSFPYDELRAAVGVPGRVDGHLTLRHTDGREITFYDGSLKMGTPSRGTINYGQRYPRKAAAYINQRIADRAGGTLQAVQSTAER